VQPQSEVKTFGEGQTVAVEQSHPQSDCLKVPLLLQVFVHTQEQLALWLFGEGQGEAVAQSQIHLLSGEMITVPDPSQAEGQAAVILANK